MAVSLTWSSLASADVRVTDAGPCRAQASGLGARVQTLAGDAPAADVVFSATGEGTRVRVQITLSAPSPGERSLEGDDCASTVEAAALVIAMSARVPTAAPPAAPSAPATAAPPARADTQAAPLPRSKPMEVTPYATAAALVERGVLPRTGGGLGVGAGVRLDRVRFEAQFDLMFSQRVEARPGVGGEFSMVGATLRGCLDLVGAPARRFELAPCVGAALDAVSGTGFGTGTTRDQTSLLAGPAVGLLASATLAPWLGLRATAEGVLPIGRQSFVIADLGALHRPSAVFARAQFGPEVRF